MRKEITFWMTPRISVRAVIECWIDNDSLDEIKHKYVMENGKWVRRDFLLKIPSRIRATNCLRNGRASKASDRAQFLVSTLLCSALAAFGNITSLRFGWMRLSVPRRHAGRRYENTTLSFLPAIDDFQLLRYLKHPIMTCGNERTGETNEWKKFWNKMKSKRKQDWETFQ